MCRIALIGENSIGYINSLLDIWNNGDCAVLLDWRIPFQTSVEMMLEANVSACFIEKSLYDKIQKNNIHSITFIPYDKQNISAELLPYNIHDKFLENYSQDEAIVIYSSGTTGASKGIILSHYAINRNADLIASYMKLQANDCMYIVKSLTHSSTIVGELLVALKNRINVLISSTMLPPKHVFDNILKFNVTIICVNPTLAALYVKEQKSMNFCFCKLRTIYISGAPLHSNLQKTIKQTFKNTCVYNVYGLSETGPRIAAQRSEFHKDGSVGFPLDDVFVIIVDEHGNLVPNETIGTIHVTTPCLFKGYITGTLKHASMYKNWFNTGDLGYFDNDGELYIVGRIDDIIIVHAHKIYPTDVEQRIVSITQVQECIVIKQEKNGDEYLICCYISSTELEVEKIRKLREILLPYETPRFFIRCPKFPRNNNGKVLRKEIEKSMN